MEKDMYIYPVIVSEETDKSGINYFISIPDFDGFTQANDLEESILMARDYIGNAMIELYEKDEEFPKFNLRKLNNLKPENDNLVISIDVNFKKILAAHKNRAVKKL